MESSLKTTLSQSFACVCRSNGTKEIKTKEWGICTQVMIQIWVFVFSLILFQLIGLTPRFRWFVQESVMNNQRLLLTAMFPHFVVALVPLQPPVRNLLPSFSWLIMWFEHDS